MTRGEEEGGWTGEEEEKARGTVCRGTGWPARARSREEEALAAAAAAAAAETSTSHTAALLAKAATVPWPRWRCKAQ